MVRKRVLLLAFSLAFLVNQLMLFESNRALPADNSRTVSDNQEERCFECYGFRYVIDPYQNVWSTWEVYNQTRVFVVDVTDGSPAAIAGLRKGDEILRINGDRVVKCRSYDAVDSMLNLDSTVKLQIKNINDKKEEIIMKKGNVCIFEETTDSLFNSYWKQVSNVDIENTSEILSDIASIGNKLSPQLLQDLSNVRRQLNNWELRRKQFRNGYNMCLTNSADDNGLRLCLDNLVGRALLAVSQDRDYEMQREFLQTQYQMQRENLRAQQWIQMQQNNAMHDYANALRNQRVNINHNINQNVRHSGTVNVNGNYNHRYYGW